MIFSGFEDGTWQPMEGGYLGLKSLPKSGQKVAGKHHKRAGQRSAMEEEVEEEEDDLACLGG